MTRSIRSFILLGASMWHAGRWSLNPMIRQRCQSKIGAMHACRAIVVMAALTIPAAFHDQPSWGDVERKEGVTFLLLTPQISDYSDTASGIQSLSRSGACLLVKGRWRTSRLHLSTELALEYDDYQLSVVSRSYRDSVSGDSVIIREYGYGRRTRELGTSSLYVGAEIPLGDPRWQSEVGIRAPMSPAGVGRFAELERFTAYVDAVSVHVGFRFVSNRAQGPKTSLALGSDIVISQNLGGYWVTLSGNLELPVGRHRVTLGAVSQVDTDPYAVDRLTSQVEALVETSLGALRPGLSVRLWLDRDRREEVPVVLGLRLRTEL